MDGALGEVTRAAVFGPFKKYFLCSWIEYIVHLVGTGRELGSEMLTDNQRGAQDAMLLATYYYHQSFTLVCLHALNEMSKQGGVYLRPYLAELSQVLPPYLAILIWPIDAGRNSRPHS